MTDRSILILLAYLSLFLSCGGQRKETKPLIRNIIHFQDSANFVQDSIINMNRLMSEMAESDSKNAFFDNNNFLFVNNVRICRLQRGDSLSNLDSLQLITGFSKDTTIRFVNLALYLRDNRLDGWFRHRLFDIIFYEYQGTPTNRYKDLRYIVLFDRDFESVKGVELESFQLLDRKDRLLLIAPSDVNVKDP